MPRALERKQRDECLAVVFHCSIIFRFGGLHALRPFSGSRFATILQSCFATILLSHVPMGTPRYCHKSFACKALAAAHQFIVGFGMFVAYVKHRTVGSRLGNGSAVIEERTRRRVVDVVHLPITTDVLLLYPGVSLQDQIGIWAMRHPQRHVETFSARSQRDLRVLLRYAGTVLVDATEDPARARKMFVARSHVWALTRSSCIPKPCTTPWSCLSAGEARCSSWDRCSTSSGRTISPSYCGPKAQPRSCRFRHGSGCDLRVGSTVGKGSAPGGLSVFAPASSGPWPT